MLKIGITGSNGFIGWHLKNRLRLYSDKYEIILFKREFFNTNFYLDDFTNKCDIIVHLACINRHIDNEYLYNKNLELTTNLINSLVRTKFSGLLLFSSSIHEYNENVFGNSKKESSLLFEKWALQSNAKYISLIIPNVFGPFGVPFYNSVISTFCHQIINNEKPIVNNDSLLKLIYIDDLISIIITKFSFDKKIIIFEIPYTNISNVSELLYIFNNFKSSYVDKYEIPLLSNKFELNLFNTFRSYIVNFEHFPVNYLNNLDNRGNFVEIIKEKIGGQVSFSTTKPGIIRGNHFHTRKLERFSVIKGSAIIKLRKVGTNIVHSFFLSEDEPSFVDIPLWHVHNIENVGSQDLFTIFWINEYYNPIDSDTYYENV